MLQTDFQQLINEKDETMNNTDEQEDIQSKKDDLAPPTINAARFGKQDSNNRPSTSFKPASTQFNPTRCKVCGMTQKECH